MTVSPERKAQLIAELEELIGPTKMEKPKIVANEEGVIRDADPHVSRIDKNYPFSDEGVVRVRRSDFVTVNMDLYEAQQEAKREDRRRRRILDPYRLGHWGPTDD